MLSVEEALERLLAACQPVAEREQVATLDTYGRVLAQDLVSPIDVPPLDNSQMDGYAVRCADVAAVGARLPVAQRIAAGQVGAALAPGTAARIFTGAPMPAGADAIVMQEAGACRRRACGLRRGAAARAVDPPRRHRRAPRQRGPGRRRAPRCRRAGAGRVDRHRAVQVVRRVRVAVFSTGDELVMPGEPLPPGRIYNSNRFMLRGLLQALGCEIEDLGIVPDSLAATRRSLRRGGGAVRPHRHLGRGVGGRGGSRQARGPGRGHARSLADRDETRQAAGLRTRARRALHRPAGQSGVELRHLPAVRAARSSGDARARATLRRRAGRCVRTSICRAATSGASSCACAATSAAGSSCFPTRIRRFSRRASGPMVSSTTRRAARSRAATCVAFLPFAELLR